MDRIFQDYEGEIKELMGARFTVVKSLVDDVDDNVYLLWLYDESSKYWYRIFIDGAYCGVDRYSQDNSIDDDDDDEIWQDHSKWFEGKVVLSATVSFGGNVDDDIVLSLCFGKRECKLICKFEVGNCRLEFA